MGDRVWEAILLPQRGNISLVYNTFSILIVEWRGLPQGSIPLISISFSPHCNLQKADCLLQNFPFFVMYPVSGALKGSWAPAQH